MRFEMINTTVKLILGTAFFALQIQSAYSQSETLIPRSMAGDKGKYYLLERKSAGQTIMALHKRVGVDSIGYTRTETNCLTKQMREWGYSENSPPKVSSIPSKWFDLIDGSSKDDLAVFLCKK
jgi:hypothetical protein